MTLSTRSFRPAAERNFKIAFFEGRAECSLFFMSETALVLKLEIEGKIFLFF